jgi:hypothetical protein
MRQVENQPFSPTLSPEAPRFLYKAAGLCYLTTEDRLSVDINQISVFRRNFLGFQFVQESRREYLLRDRR